MRPINGGWEAGEALARGQGDIDHSIIHWRLDHGESTFWWADIVEPQSRPSTRK